MSIYFLHIFKRTASFVSAALLAMLALVTPGIVPAQASSTQSNNFAAPTVNCLPPENHVRPECQTAAHALANRRNGTANITMTLPEVVKPWRHNISALVQPTAAQPDKAPYSPPTDCTGVAQIPATECQGLLALYTSTAGASWSNSTGKWITTTPCSWFGVTCTSGHVTQLQLIGNNLVGTIPAAMMTGLTSLKILDLSSNTLTGTIPALPSALTQLYLYINSLSGTIPALPSGLIDLDLGSNQLTGSIPTLPAGLTLLDLTFNQLSGGIPVLPTGLVTTYLYVNKLTGTIPAIPTSAVNFNVGTNLLTGTIPPISSLISLAYFGVDTNQLTGSIPTLPPGMQTLYAYDNNLSGSIPALPSSLLTLVASGDNLTGTIPALPSGLITFNVGYLYDSGYNLHRNNLTGTIPALPSTLKYLFVDANSLTGTIPALPASLIQFGAGYASDSNTNTTYHNSLSGSIPDLSALTALTYLDLDTNLLSGSIPALSALTSLTSLYLYGNLLTGAIPALPNGLVNMSLSSNSLTGSIPTLSGLASVSYLDFSYNQLSGVIPALPSSLGDFDAAYNYLSGTIPTLPASLGYLYLYHNSLTGAIPALPATIKQLDLFNNQLTGSIPTLSGTVMQDIYVESNKLAGVIPTFPSSLKYLDASHNQLAGVIPALPAGLVYLNLFDNQLTGSIPALPATLYEMELNSNQLTGTIPVSITTTVIPTYATYTVQYLTLCGGHNTLSPANAAVSAFIGVRILPWTGQCSPSPIESVGVLRGNNFYLRNSNTTGFADISVTYNPAGTNAFPVVGDWTGGGYDTVGIFDQSNGLFSLCKLNDTASCASPSNILQLVLGNANDQPLAGRWVTPATNDGVGVFRPSNGLIYLKNALTTGFANYTMVLGIPGDVGLAGDWNGDGNDSLGVYRPSTTTFYLSNARCNCSVFGDYQMILGIAGDVPIAGDWPGQGFGGVGVFRPSNGIIFLKYRLTTGFADIYMVYGIANDKPVAGHWAVTGSIPRPPPPVIVAPGLRQPSASAPANIGLGD